MGCRRRILASAAMLMALVGCGRPSGPLPVVALVVAGDAAKRAESSASTADLGVELRVQPAPAAVGPLPPETATIEAQLARARADYASGELARVRSCAERLADPELVWSALERQSTVLAARVLVWRIACTSITRRELAVESARTFVSLGLELPADVDAIPVEAHRILTTALHEAETVTRRELALRSKEGPRPVAAKIQLDGRAACTSDCVVSVSPGDHLVRAERAGSTPTSRTVRVDAAAARSELTLTLTAASPELAARQWASTYASESSRAESNESVSLLSQALRARRLVYLQVDTLGSGVRIRGALANDGRVSARTEERGSVESASRDALRDLLVRGGVVEDRSVVKKPLFWVAVAAAAVASSLVTAYLLYDPGTRTEVRTR